VGPFISPHILPLGHRVLGGFISPEFTGRKYSPKYFVVSHSNKGRGVFPKSGVQTQTRVFLKCFTVSECLNCNSLFSPKGGSHVSGEGVKPHKIWVRQSYTPKRNLRGCKMPPLKEEKRGFFSKPHPEILSSVRGGGKNPPSRIKGASPVMLSRKGPRRVSAPLFFESAPLFFKRLTPTPKNLGGVHHGGDH